MSEALSYADEGTIAHKLLELCVRKGLCSPLEYIGKKITVKGEDKQHSILSPSGADRYLACLGSIPTERKKREVKDISMVITREMANAVEVAVDYIRNIHDGMKKPTLIAEHEVWIECLDYQKQDGHGTIDVILYNETDVHVIDYKHGQGYVVPVEKNNQATLYAIGELNNGKHKKKRWHLHIAQPRASHPDGPCRKWTTDDEYLRKFEADVTDRIGDHDPTRPTFNPGELQCKYCDKRKTCPALAQKAIEAAGSDFKAFIGEKKVKPTVHTPGALTAKQLAAAMKNLGLLALFAESVKEAVWGRLNAGDLEMQKFFKLVEGKSNRKWRAEDVVMREFKKLGLSIDLYAPRKLVGIGDGESILPKAKRERFMEKHAYKPNGQPTIADVDDPRKAIRPNSAHEDFKDHIED